MDAHPKLGRRWAAWLVAVMLTATGAAAKGASVEAVVVAAPAAPRLEGMAARSVNVSTTGAKGDGIADDTGALQAALDGGRRTVVVPPGTYVISAPLQLDSETTLRLEPGATVRLADGAGNAVGIFLLKNRDPAGGNHDIVVEGGIWDGNNEHNPRGKTPPCYTGVALNFVNVRRLVLKGLVVRNPETFAIRVWRLTDFRIEDIGFDFTALRSSQDGVHLNGFCARGLIRNIRALSPEATNDDMIALNADDATGEKPRVRVMCQGVELGPIRDIRIEHVRAESAYTFVRLLSSGNLIENVIMSDVAGGVRACAINLNRWLFPVGGGNIRNVVLRDFDVKKMPSPKLEKYALVHVQSGVQNFHIENFHRAEGPQPPAPTLLIENGFENHIRLNGIDRDQSAALLAQSPELKREEGAPPIAASKRVLLETRALAKIVLPSGGFSSLAIDSRPVPPPPLAVTVPPAPKRQQAPPTLANVPYGEHPRQVLDFWRAPSSAPTPVLVYIHGGGWLAGNKTEPVTDAVADVDLARYLAAGISVVSINYRFVTDAIFEGIRYPVEWPMHDAARAIQFVRSKAREWNLDKTRLAVSGASAGACTSLWLAFHDDLSDPRSNDPVARESTRVTCAAVLNAQTTLDPRQMVDWTPNSTYGGHAFGYMPDPRTPKTRDAQFSRFLADRDVIWDAIREYSPWDNVTADDPPVFLVYAAVVGPPAMGKPQINPTHTANFGLKLAEKLASAGVAHELIYPGSPPAVHSGLQEFLMDQLLRHQ